MTVASLYNLPEDDKDFAVMSFANMDQHRQIVDAILGQKGIALTLFPLDPLPLHDVATWAYQHQAAHNDFCRVLGINGVDLTSVDLNDRAQLSAWLTLHGDEHRQASELLGLGG